MKKAVPVFVMFLVLFAECGLAQSKRDIKKILDEFGNTAKSYLLSANRPSFSISSFTTPKNKVNIDFGAAFNEDFVEFPFGIGYGVSGRVELFAGIPIYTQSYNFNGEKIDGIGDANIGIKYKFQESDKLEHAAQVIVKIPTANSSAGLGTGKADFHFGLAQGYYMNNFSYDFSAELNFLRRRDFPDLGKVPRLLQPAIDSIKNVYNYKYEKELIVSFSPAYNLTYNFAVYSGVSFSRNFKLDYNTLQIFGGLGYSFSDKVSVSAGAAFGLLNEKSWLISTGINLQL